MKKIDKGKGGSLLEDWFSDRDERYIRVRKDGRDCWEDRLETGQSLSSVFLDREMSKEELLCKAYTLADETVISMNTPCRVRVSVGGEDSCTDGKRLFVATRHFDDDRLSPGEMTDIFVGLAAHEGAHLLYTDFGVKSDDGFVRGMTNVLEDERIERLLGQDKPGLVTFLGTVKRYYFDRAFEDASREMPTGKTVRFFNLLLKIIRYPKDLDESEVALFEPYLLRCREILSPYPDSTEACREAAERIRDLIAGMAEDEMKEKDGGGCPGKGHDGHGEDGRPAGSPAKPSGHSCGSGGKMDPSEPSSAEEVIEALAETVRAMTSYSEDSDENRSDAIRSGEIPSDVVERKCRRGRSRNVLIHDDIPENDLMPCGDPKRLYTAALDEVRRYIPMVSRAIRGLSEERTCVYSGLRSGRLDTHKLSQAVQGVPSIYSRTVRQLSQRIAVCLLIDESGSMMSDGRFRRARQTAILMYEALSRCPNVELYIYGHTASLRKMHENNSEKVGKPFALSSIDIIAYKDRCSGTFDKYRLGEITARAENFDGIAIDEVASLVRMRTKLPCLMFVISDGQPIYWPEGSSAETHTRQMVEKVTADGFYPIQVCLTEDQEPESMFRHFVKYTDMDRFPQELGRLVKGEVLKRMNKALI